MYRQKIVPLSIKDGINHFHVQVKYSFHLQKLGDSQIYTY